MPEGTAFIMNFQVVVVYYYTPPQAILLVSAQIPALLLFLLFLLSFSTKASRVMTDESSKVGPSSLLGSCSPIQAIFPFFLVPECGLAYAATT
jgi:hypothetical protein